MNVAFAHIIEEWYAANRRELPWRDTKDAYRIWISEIILQQTRVAQGYDYYLRFLERFPTVEALASASEDDVLLEWQGLGYYSRARNLHKAAQQVVEMGGFPTTFATIRQLCGVGDYTAAAIASFAFGEPCAVLDGNVYRVLSRYLGIDTPIDTTQGKKTFTALAQEMLDAAQPALYNQAIMDFGAMVCTPRSAACATCPLCETCAACREGRVEELPVKSKTLKIRTRHLIYIFVRFEGQVLLHRRGPNDIWQGLYEPLLLEDVSPEEHPLVKALLDEGCSLSLLKSGVKHQLSHQLLLADFYLLDGNEAISSWAQANGYLVVPESSLSSYAVPRLVEDLFKLCRQ